MDTKQKLINELENRVQLHREQILETNTYIEAQRDVIIDLQNINYNRMSEIKELEQMVEILKEQYDIIFFKNPS